MSEISLSVISFLNEWEVICLYTSIVLVSTQLSGVNYCNLTLRIQFSIDNIFHTMMCLQVLLIILCLNFWDEAL